MKLVATTKSEQNQAAFDPWTAVHFSAGLALGLMDTPVSVAVAASIAYEFAEQGFERSDAGQALFETRGPESLINAFVDSVALIAGHRLGRMWNER